MPAGFPAEQPPGLGGIAGHPAGVRRPPVAGIGFHKLFPVQPHGGKGHLDQFLDAMPFAGCEHEVLRRGMLRGQPGFFQLEPRQHQPVNLVIFLQQQFGQIGTVLPRTAGDQSSFHMWSFRKSGWN